MIPRDREELQALAGEYVLGTLDPPTRREVEQALAGDTELRRAVAFWEERLHGLSALAPSVEPPAGTWERISARLDADRSRKAGPWQSLRLWRGVAATVTAVAAGLLLYIVVGPSGAGPRFVALLHAPQQDQAVWVATADRSGMLIHAVAEASAPPDRAFELWAIPPGATQPQALGVIPDDNRFRVGTVPAAVRGGGTLAISVEPKLGSPTGQPTGPVVFVGTIIAVQ